MSSQWHKPVSAFVLTVWCLSLLHAQVLDEKVGNLGKDRSHEFGPPYSTDGSTPRDQPPHLILIVADDLGWNDVSWHNPTVLSPHLGKLAAEGVTLNRSYVQPICTPTRSALLASRYPFTLGRQNNVLRPMIPTGLSLDVSLLPEELHKLGYETNMVGKWHLGFCKEEYTPTKRGFDNFFGYYCGAEDYYTHEMNQLYVEAGTLKKAEGYDFRLNMTSDREVAGTYSAFSYADRAVFLLTERNPVQPMFLYLAFQSVHSPLEVPKNYSNLYNHIEDINRRNYLGMVTAMDEAVGKVVAALKETGHYDNSVIVFTTDNGGPTSSGSSNTPLRGNKTSLWEGGTRGPAFIHSPLLSSPGTVSNRTIHVTDWFPTFLHLAGGSPPPGIDGVNQWEVLNNSSLTDARDYFVYDIDNTDNLRAALRWNQYKLIVGNPGPWPETQDNITRYPPVTDGIGDFKVLETASTSDANQVVNLSEEEETASSGPIRTSETARHGQTHSSSQEAERFVQDAALYFRQKKRVQRQTTNSNKCEQMEEKREINTDEGSTSEVEDFKSLSSLLNSSVTIQLYDVIDDAEEQNDISKAHSDIVKLLMSRLIDEFARYVTIDFPPDEPKANPSNFHSTWSHGWC